MGRNLEARNFGFKTRDMNSAGNKAIAERGRGIKTQADLRQRFKLFTNYLKDHTDIRRLNDVSKDTVRDYANYLQDRDLGASTLQNYLSAVNVTMEQCRLDSDVHLDPVREAGMPQRNGIATSSKFVDQDRHDEAKDHVSERLGAMMDLQREFGLRFKESCLLDANKCLADLNKGNFIHVDRGTKGGQARDIPLNEQHRDSQIEALRKAADIQGNQYHLIPENTSFKQFQRECYSELKNTDLNGFHTERHTYANDRYEQLTGFKSPVESPFSHGKEHIDGMAKALDLTNEQAKELDRYARTMISEELGHHRLDVTNKYLG